MHYVAVELGAGMVKARDAAPDIAWRRGVAFGLDPKVADDVDALAGRDVLQGDAAGRTAQTSPMAVPYSRATVPPARPRKMSASVARCSTSAPAST